MTLPGARPADRPPLAESHAVPRAGTRGHEAAHRRSLLATVS